TRVVYRSITHDPTASTNLSPTAAASRWTSFDTTSLCAIRNVGKLLRVSAPSCGAASRYTRILPLVSRLAIVAERPSPWMGVNDRVYESTAPPDGSVACLHPAGAGPGLSHRNGPGFAAAADAAQRQSDEASTRPATIAAKTRRAGGRPPTLRVSFADSRASALDAAVCVVRAAGVPVAVAVVVAALRAARRWRRIRRTAAAAAPAAAGAGLVLDERTGRCDDVPEAAVQVQRLTGGGARLAVTEVAVERPLVVGRDPLRAVLVAAEQRLLRAARGDELRAGRHEHRRPDHRAVSVAGNRLALVGHEHVERAALAVHEDRSEPGDRPGRDLQRRRLVLRPMVRRQSDSRRSQREHCNRSDHDNPFHTHELLDLPDLDAAWNRPRRYPLTQPD